MSARSQSVTFLIVLAAALAAPSLRAQDGLDGALPRASRGPQPTLAAPFVPTLAVADFDNDHKLDGAVLLDAGRVLGQSSFRIQFHLSGTDNTEVAFESAEPQLAIRALDINHDGSTDVVVEHPVTHKRLYVWLNDGHGVFHKGRIEDYPSADLPCGKHLELPSSWMERPSVCLPQQRGSDDAMLAGSFVRGRPPSDIKFNEAVSSSFASSRPFSSVSSRAPPSIPL